jgi:hypothetical protein
VIPSLKIQEIAKFHTETPAGTPFIATSAFLFAMNPAKYESLPADLKKVIDANSGAETSAWAGKIWDEQPRARRASRSRSQEQLSFRASRRSGKLAKGGRGGQCRLDQGGVGEGHGRPEADQ